nr:hypothetical protein [Tanacetum cinerariifolium]
MDSLAKNHAVIIRDEKTVHISYGDEVISRSESQFDDKLHLVKEPIEIVDREVERLTQSRISINKPQLPRTTAAAISSSATITQPASPQLPPRPLHHNRHNYLNIIIISPTQPPLLPATIFSRCHHSQQPKTTTPSPRV